MAPEDRDLEQGRAAFERRAWAEARDRLGAARDRLGVTRDRLGAARDRPGAAPDRLDPEDLERLAIASSLVGDGDGLVRALEEAHQAYLAGDAPRAAARCAFWIGFHLANAGEMALASGWLGRAGRLLERVDDDCPERGYLLLPVGQRQLGTGDYDACVRTAREAEALAQRFGDDDLLTLALHMRGRATLRRGQVEEGLALLDEAMVAVVSDELSPQVTGVVYCSVIAACREVWALRRAREWTGALTSWCDRQPDMVAYSGECRVFRAEILQRHGAWHDAIREAQDAIERMSGGPGSRTEGAAWYERGEAHRLLGEHAAAEEAYRAANARGFEPQPGLALLRLAQGDADAARSALDRALGERSAPHARARLLPAYVEVLVDAADLATAGGACDELEELAARWDSEVLSTTAIRCRGAIALAADDAREALPLLRRAWEQWRALDMPYEAARAHMLLGLACRALGDEDGAELALAGARKELERLGARAELRRLDAALGRSTRRGDHGLTPREREVLAQLATGRTNRAIAQALFISEKTVARHVANIFGKLGLSSRAAATAYAYEHDLQGPPPT